MLCLQIINFLLVLGLTKADNIRYKFENGQKFIEKIIGAEIWSSLHYKSVYINEVEKISINPFLSNVEKITDKNMNRILLAFVITLKCQCARNITKILASILIPHCRLPTLDFECIRSNKGSAKYEVDETVMSLLETLNEMVVLTIDTVFKINEIIPILKSNEPSFLKNLLSMHLYCSNLLRLNKSMKANKGKNMSTENNTSPELGDGKEHNNDDPLITNLDQVLNMILQIDNLLNGFEIRNCDSRNINII